MELDQSIFYICPKCQCHGKLKAIYTPVPQLCAMCGTGIDPEEVKRQIASGVVDPEIEKKRVKAEWFWYWTNAVVLSFWLVFLCSGAPVAVTGLLGAIMLYIGLFKLPSLRAKKQSTPSN